MELMYRSLFLLILVSLSHAAPEHREDEHYKDGKHNEEYDHKTFLGESQQKEFEQLSPAESAEKFGKLVDKIDKNGDGNVSESELTAWIEYISLKEATESVKKLLPKQYSEAVRNDSFISWEEFIAANFPGPLEFHGEEVKKRLEKNRKRFQAADENRDDKLSFEEHVAFSHPDLFPRMHKQASSELFEAIDMDKDGVITLVDLQKDSRFPEAEIKKEFEDRDTNHNGQLEQSEIQEWYYPSTFNVNQNEARHLIRRADADENGNLTKKEILDNYNIFVSSKATHWGASLERPSDEL